MSMFDDMAGAGDVSWVAKEAEMPTSLKDACSSVLVLVLVLVLDLEQIMNHPQMCLTISDQDKDLFMYVNDLEVSEGG